MPSLRGPRGRIQYTRDDLGYPSIDANSLEEASWARGWFHATDRLVQVQLTLAIARGRALELMGDIPLARYADRMTRLHRFTDDLDEQVAKLTPDVRPFLDAYCAGFNTGVRERGWPLLLRAAGIPRAEYRPQDFLSLLRIVTWFGLNQFVEMATLVTGQLISLKASPSLLGLLLGDAATEEEIAKAPIAAWPAELDAFVTAGSGGSNAVAVAATRSATGGALLIADPHLEISRIPPVLYAMHASHGGGAYMQGLHIPGFWYASFGRTDRVAWTYTYGRVQSVDTRIVRCRRGEMFDGTAWRPLTQRTSTVKIKKQPSEAWSFWDCELGTIVGDAQSETELALPCVRWAGMRETYKDGSAGLGIVRAENLEELIEVNRGLSLSCFDAIIADTTGRIGHVMTGRLDARPATSGGVVPREPDGQIARADEKDRPITLDPSVGWLVSANNRPIETSSRMWVPMGDTPSRYQRLAELVGANERATLDDLAKYVLDASDAGAKRLLAAWAPHMPDHPRARGLVAWAAAQPGKGSEHFAELALWTALHGEVCRTLFRKHLGARGDALLDDLIALQLFRQHIDSALALERPHHLDTATLREVLAEAFPRALTKAALPHNKLPLVGKFKNAVFAGKLSFLLDSRPIENRGGPTTPNQVTQVMIAGQRATFGAAGRFVCDMSKPFGWYCMSGGASERRFKIGYGQGLEDWARGKFRPLGSPTGPAPFA